MTEEIYKSWHDVVGYTHCENIATVRHEGKNCLAEIIRGDTDFWTFKLIEDFKVGAIFYPYKRHIGYTTLFKIDTEKDEYHLISDFGKVVVSNKKEMSCLELASYTGSIRNHISKIS